MKKIRLFTLKVDQNRTKFWKMVRMRTIGGLSGPFWQHCSRSFMLGIFSSQWSSSPPWSPDSPSWRSCLELGSVYSQLQHLNLYLATGDRCPLDKVTWLLALCLDLTHLSVLSQTVHREVQSSINRFNIVISTREFALPSLNTVIWNIRNESYPSLLVSEVKQRLRNCLSQRSSQFITDQTRLFSKRSQQCLKVSEIQQQPSDCQERGLCFPLSMYKNLAELCSHSNLPDDTFKTLEKISFLFSSLWLRLQLPIGNIKRLRHLEIRDLIRGLTSEPSWETKQGRMTSPPSSSLRVRGEVTRTGGDHSSHTRADPGPCSSYNQPALCIPSSGPSQSHGENCATLWSQTREKKNLNKTLKQCSVFCHPLLFFCRKNVSRVTPILIKLFCNVFRFWVMMSPSLLHS